MTTQTLAGPAPRLAAGYARMGMALLDCAPLGDVAGMVAEQYAAAAAHDAASQDAARAECARRLAAGDVAAIRQRFAALLGGC